MNTKINSFIVRALAISLAFIIGVGCGSLWIILPTEQTQPTRTEPPAIESFIPEDTFITLERTACYGTCPNYTVAVSADGTVIFSGSYYKTVKGVSVWTRTGVIKSRISQEQVQRLIDEFERANYLSLKNSYVIEKDGCPAVATDNPTAYTSIQINGQNKSVKHYLGCLYLTSGFDKSYPKELTALENRIDEIINTKQWMQY
ncbi:MAG TPA: DUF6438 domain-containing protein [Pyrinomonadaceae bacterium]|jgi:hypothetical protein